MLFSSIPFLFYFLPIVLLACFLAPRQLKNAVLLAASLLFYAWGEPRYVFLMIASIMIGYVSGLLIEAFQKKGLSRFFLTLSVILNLGFFVYFKYADFFIENFNAITGLSIPLLRITLPIGISFYTFQILSYVIDVYWGKVSAQRNFIQLAAYIAMFPQLIAGPIVRYADINRELQERTCSVEDFALGVRRFVFGLSKKVLIANVLGELCDTIQNSDDKAVLFFWLYGAALALHIYFDFSGYSDMAIGLGRLLGFHFPENFCYPYISKSVTEFWRRWHMSLGAWFRDYVYIPLGGNRVSKGRWFFNIFIVWMLTGFWHGAAWNFVIWGLFFAVLLVIEKSWLLDRLEKCRVFAHLYMVFAVMVSFIIFNATDMREAVTYLLGMVGALGNPLVSRGFIYYLKSYAVVLLLGILGATPLLKRMTAVLRGTALGEKALNLLEPVILAGLMLLITAYLVDGSFNPFLYFRF